jgi:hypothetical protein
MHSGLPRFRWSLAKTGKRIYAFLSIFSIYEILRSWRKVFILIDRKRDLLYCLTSPGASNGVKKYLLDCKFITISCWYFVLNNPVRRFLHFNKFFITLNQNYNTSILSVIPVPASVWINSDRPAPYLIRGIQGSFILSDRYSGRFPNMPLVIEIPEVCGRKGKKEGLKEMKEKENRTVPIIIMLTVSFIVMRKGDNNE